MTFGAGRAVELEADRIVEELDPARWFAVQCLAHNEWRASKHLVNQSFPVFLPFRRKTRRHARRVETVLRPFFPGYLFVSLNLSRDQWRKVNGTYGVSRLVMQGGLPAPVPVGVVEALQENCDGEGELVWHPELKEGQAVRIAEGPFSDLVGQLERLDDSGRVRVLLNIMGRAVSTAVRRDHVLPAESAL